MKLHEQLESLYDSKWKGMAAALQAVSLGEQATAKPAYPFLLSVQRWDNGYPDESWYTGADLRVMVFGQETNGWVGDSEDEPAFGSSPVFNPDVPMGAVMGIHENFYATHYHQDGFSYNGARYGSFFHGFNRFVSLLGTRFPGRRIACMWNNIVKFGKAEGSGFCGEEIYDVQKQHFMVAGKEVEILKPHLILFLTGNYDSRICDYWAGARFTALPPFTAESVAKVALPGLDIPAYRTNHPSARLPKEEKEAQLEAIVNDFWKLNLND